MSLRQNAKLLQIATRFPEAVSAALGFISALHDRDSLTDAAVREIIRNAEVLAKLGAHPGYSVSELLRVVRWLVHIADKPDSLRKFLREMQEDLGE